jgi:hypothetical protein
MRQVSISEILIRSHKSLIQTRLKNLNVKARTSINLKGPWFELREVPCVLPLCALGGFDEKLTSYNSAIKYYEGPNLIRV